MAFLVDTRDILKFDINQSAQSTLFSQRSSSCICEDKTAEKIKMSFKIIIHLKHAAYNYNF
jgi:hypothetical protein